MLFCMNLFKTYCLFFLIFFLGYTKRRVQYDPYSSAPYENYKVFSLYNAKFPKKLSAKQIKVIEEMRKNPFLHIRPIKGGKITKEMIRSVSVDQVFFTGKQTYDVPDQGIRPHFTALTRIVAIYLGNKDDPETKRMMKLALKAHEIWRRNANLIVAPLKPIDSLFKYGADSHWDRVLIAVKDLLKENKSLGRFRNDFLYANMVHEMFAPLRSIFIGQGLSDKLGLYGPPKFFVAFTFDDPRKVHAYLKGFKRYLDHVLIEAKTVFRHDGVIYHHNTYYPRYGTIPLQKMSKIIEIVSGTEYQPNEETYYMIEKLYSHAYKVGVFKGGGFVTARGTPSRGTLYHGGLALIGASNLINITDAAKKGNQKEMFARLAPITSWYTKKVYDGIKPHPFIGSTYFPHTTSFAKVTDKYSVFVTGQKKGYKHLESYNDHKRYQPGSANIFGSSQAFGGIELAKMGRGNDGYDHKGYDFSQIGGQTVFDIPLENLYIDFIAFSDYGLGDICGGVGDRKNGIFINDLGGNYPSQLRMKKVVFFFKDKLLNTVKDLTVRSVSLSRCYLVRYISSQQIMLLIPLRTVLAQKSIQGNSNKISIKGVQNNQRKFSLKLNEKNVFFTDNLGNGYFIPKKSNIGFELKTQHSYSRGRF